MSNAFEINHIFATRELSIRFDKIMFKLRRNYIYKQNGLLLEADKAYRWAQNVEIDGRRFTLMFVTTKQVNPEKATKIIQTAGKRVTIDQIKQLTHAPLDTGIIAEV